LPFTAILNSIIDDMKDAIGVIILDIDGECVQLATQADEHDIKVIGAYQVIHL